MTKELDRRNLTKFKNYETNLTELTLIRLKNKIPKRNLKENGKKYGKKTENGKEFANPNLNRKPAMRLGKLLGKNPSATRQALVCGSVAPRQNLQARLGFLQQIPNLLGNGYCVPDWLLARPENLSAKL